MTWKNTIKKNRPALTRENILLQELPLNDKTERGIIAGKYKMFDILMPLILLLLVFSFYSY